MIYSAWETDDIIGHELTRNLSLALACVFLISLVMLADLRLTFMVLTCVVLILVDVIGMLHFWGLTIDTIVCVCIVVVVGLCVDYSLHIAHAFGASDAESSADRASEAVADIGPAILNGGTTTCLALLLLAFSNSYGFIAMFRIFFLSVAFGLFHGLAFLPVLLMTFGGNNPDVEQPSETREKVIINQLSNYQHDPIELESIIAAKIRRPAGIIQRSEQTATTTKNAPVTT